MSRRDTDKISKIQDLARRELQRAAWTVRLSRRGTGDNLVKNMTTSGAEQRAALETKKAELDAASESLLKMRFVAEQQRVVLRDLYRDYDKAISSLITGGKVPTDSKADLQKLINQQQKLLDATLVQLDRQSRAVQELKREYNEQALRVKRGMTNSPLLKSETYTPDKLLDVVIARLGLKNDAALCQALQMSPVSISNLRNRRIPAGAALLVRLHEATNMSVKELRQLMGDTRENFAVELYLDAA